jgi:hypothetical protein
MTKKINVNPNFYKDGGREHTEGLDKGDAGTEQTTHIHPDKPHHAPGKDGQPNFIPGQTPTGEPGRDR